MTNGDRKCPKGLLNRYVIVSVSILDNAVISQKGNPQAQREPLALQ